MSPALRLPKEVHAPFAAVAVIEPFEVLIETFSFFGVTEGASSAKVTVPLTSVEVLAVASISKSVAVSFV